MKIEHQSARYLYLRAVPSLHLAVSEFATRTKLLLQCAILCPSIIWDMATPMCFKSVLMYTFTTHELCVNVYVLNKDCINLILYHIYGK